MKVYIGPYRSWIGPYQIAKKVFFWIDHRGIFADRPVDYERWDYRAYEKFGDFLADQDWLVKFCSWMHSKKKRKIKVRIDEYDTWSMDHTIAIIAHPMLVKLRAEKHGSQFVDDEDVPEHIRSTSAPELTEEEKHYGHSDAFLHDRWTWVLDEMIFAFALELDDDWESAYYDRNDIDGMNKVFERQKNGFRLFGKYYQGLWD